MLDSPTTTAGRADYDLNAKALRHWPVLFAMMVDMYGRPQFKICAVGRRGCSEARSRASQSVARPAAARTARRPGVFWLAQRRRGRGRNGG